MTKIYYESDADMAAISGQSVAVVGYGNQGRSWALNLRDSGVDARVCVRADASREQARKDGFATGELSDASAADIVCVLVPDDAIPKLPLERRDDSLTIVASGYSLAFHRFRPAGDIAMIAPRMLGPEVRLCYEEGIGFITALGVETDVTGTALARTLAIAKAIGGLRQGAIEMSAKQEAVLDLAVEQVLSPALTHVSQSFVATMLDEGIPLEAVVTELVLSGEVERSYRLLREIGFAKQMAFHSPTSQYGQLSRRGEFDHLDVAGKMKQLTENITSGRFADEWDAESEGGYKKLEELSEQHAGADIQAFEDDLRNRLGPRVAEKK
jgi:ketol-acid reductoisomerase